jgi:hypothetical protein
LGFASCRTRVHLEVEQRNHWGFVSCRTRVHLEESLRVREPSYDLGLAEEVRGSRELSYALGYRFLTGSINGNLGRRPCFSVGCSVDDQETLIDFNPVAAVHG